MRLTRLSETDPRRRRKFSIAKQFARYSGGTKSGAVSILAHFRLSPLYRTNPAVDAGWLPICRDSGATPCLYFYASVEIFYQHNVAFESVNAGIDDLLSVRRDIKAACGVSGRPDVQHTEVGPLVRGQV